MNRFAFRLLICCLIVTLFATVPVVASQDAKSKSDDPGKAEKRKGKPGWGKFTVSKETTYITEPLEKDGHVDYVTALNQRLSKGVTPDSNAVTLIWKALGPHPEPRLTMTPEYFKWLGIEPPPEQGDYFIPLTKYKLERLNIQPAELDTPIDQQWDQFTRRIWTEKEFPEIAAWLKVNEKPLAVIVEATKRSQYYSPLIPTRTEKGSNGLLSVWLPTAHRSRELAYVLAGRALLRAGQGDLEGAWQDLLACQRLGRLVSRGATLIESLLGFAIDQVGFRAALVFLGANRLDSNALARCWRDYENLAPRASVADKIELTERINLLETISLLDRHGVAHFNRMSEVNKSALNFLGNFAFVGIDWDPTLRIVNGEFDRLASASREKNRAAREKQLAKFEDELKAMKAKLPNPKKDTGLALSATDRATTLGNTLVVLFMPAVSNIQRAVDRAEQSQINMPVAFALARYRREKGRYPDELDQLIPNYFASIPLDIFSGKALIYRPEANGYALYSVGPNGTDDDGRDFESLGDDIVIRLPVPIPQRK